MRWIPLSIVLGMLIVVATDQFTGNRIHLIEEIDHEHIECS